jgi:hypothetical protein
VAAVVAMIGVGVHGLLHGDIGKYTAPLDANAKFCGYAKGLEAYPYMYFKDLLGSPSDILGSGVCVKACPATAGAPLSCATADAAACAEIKDAHKSYAAGHFCVPSLASLRKTKSPAYESWRSALTEVLTETPTGRKVYDLYLSSRAIYISIAMAVVYCLAYIYLMSLFAECIAWAMIALTQVGLIVASLYAAFLYKDRHTPAGPLSPDDAYKVLAAAIVLGILAALFGLAVCCGFNSLRTAINVVDASADFLRKTKRILFVPVLYFFLNVLVVFAWAVIVACFNSMGEITAETGHIPQFRKCTYSEANKDRNFSILAALTFGLLWVVAFHNCASGFIVMVSATSYYFDSNANYEGGADVALGFHLAYTSHAGSLAFGSFIVALVQFIRIVFMTLAEHAKRACGDNRAAKCIVCCAECCLACIEKVCDYITEAAFAYMAVSGDGFCDSAWNGFLLNLKHILQYAWANALAKMFVFVGKIGLCVLNCCSLWFIMKYLTNDTEEISSPAGPILVVAVFTYVCASVFLGLFDHAVMALMTCLAIDTDLNGEPKYGPPTFHDALNTVRGGQTNQIADGGWEKP